MEDNTKRLDKTIGDLTAKDVIVIGVTLCAAKYCYDVATYMMVKPVRKWSNKLIEKSEKMKAETERLNEVFPSKNK